jgi:cold shock CspA family protein
MRLQGRIESWNDQRGFGFVVQNATEKKAFVHISALSDRRRRPLVGALVTYEEGKDERGRPRAANVRFVERAAARERKSGPALRSILFGVFAVVAVAAVAFVRMTHPNSTVAASVHKLVSDRDSLRNHPEFQCEPKKTHCSEMSSCAEAYFHQEHCGATEMDGDRDGIPCERQWCQ